MVGPPANPLRKPVFLRPFPFEASLLSASSTQHLYDQLTQLLWSINSCENRAYTDQFHITVSLAQVHKSWDDVFLKVLLWPVMVFNWSQAHKTQKDISKTFPWEFRFWPWLNLCINVLLTTAFQFRCKHWNVKESFTWWKLIRNTFLVTRIFWVKSGNIYYMI